jgi:type IV fimbrial biogenesis protein FimT
MHPSRPGYGLVELLACCAVLAIAVAIAVPAMAPLVERQRASVAANRVLGLLHAGRTSAIVHRRSVQVCPSRDGLACAPDAGWHEGILVAAVARRGEPPPAPIRTLQADALRGLRLVGTRGRTSVVFQRDGRAGGSNQTLTLCDMGQRALRRIIVSNGGRARIEVTADEAPCPAPADGAAAP